MKTAQISPKMQMALDTPVNTFSSEADYRKAVEMSNIYKNARKKWCIENKTINKDGSSFCPVEIAATFPYADIITNEFRSKMEVYEFLHEKPLTYFIYINEEKKTATTWTGDFLGLVYFGNEWRTNFGDKRQDVCIWAANGIKYYGTYFKSAGSCARIKAYKNQEYNYKSIYAK